MKKRPADDTNQPSKSSYQNDPRYREFYDRLRKESLTPSPYDEELKPTSLEELEKKGWDGTLRPEEPKAPAPRVRPSAALAPPPVTTAPQPSMSRKDHAPRADLAPGVVLHLDDGSVAVYKDAVSGKDYALFYFLEPNGAFEPRGIFLEQYEFNRIGKLPEQLFSGMIERKRWDRDAVLFHLDKYDHKQFIPAAQTVSQPGDSRHDASASNASWPQVERRVGETSGVYRRRVSDAVNARASARDPLERGRVVRINLGGKVWEAIFWTRDAIGAIVAHQTNLDWSLMHLDLSRFKDSLEYGEILMPEELSRIEESLARDVKK